MLPEDMVQQKIKHLSKRQDLIMHGLDNVHRSLLINNINYENDTSACNIDSTSRSLPHEDIRHESNIKNEECLSVIRGSLNYNQYLEEPVIKTKKIITINITTINSPNLNENNKNNDDEDDGDDKKQSTSVANLLLPLKINTDGNDMLINSNNTQSSSGTDTSSSPSSSFASYDFFDSSTNDGIKSNLSSNEQDSIYSSETTTTSTKSTIKSYKKSSKKSKTLSPMLEIVQELAETCEVKSTVHVNREKIRQWNNQKLSPAKELTNHHDKNNQSKRKKYTQKIINDNVCNEILDKTINKVVDNIESTESDQSVDISDNVINQNCLLNRSIDSSIKYGKLMASSKSKTPPINKIGGKLLAKRMQRHSIDNCRLNSLINYNNKFVINEKPIKLKENKKNIINKIPPKKPPRLFTSNSSSSSTAGDCGGVNNSATTVAVGDINQISPPLSTQQPQQQLQLPKKLNASRKLGWNIEELTKPSCPTFDDIIMENKPPIKLGWTTPKSNEIPENILKMLHYDDRQSTEKHNIKTFKLKPEPQQQQKQLQSSFRNKEDIDDVDGPSLPQRSESKKSKNIERFATTIYSTPIKSPSTIISAANNQQNTNENDEYCKNCHEKLINENSHLSSVRKSFGKAALKKTKTFLEASKNILTRPTSKQITDNDNDNDLVDTEFQTPEKSETTAQFNQDTCQRYNEKKTMKILGFTPPHKNLPPTPNTNCAIGQIVANNNNLSTKKIESPKKIMEKFLSSVKRTPPKKPIRTSLLTTNTISTGNSEMCHTNNFDFQRTVNSPKMHKDCFSRHSLNLSPKCLFKQQQQQQQLELEQEYNQSTKHPQYETYKSFPDTVDDGFIIYMGEYLRQMSLKIEENKQQETRTPLTHQQMPISILKKYENEPIYTEIEPINQFELPIYAQINKSNKLKRSKSLTALPPKTTIEILKPKLPITTSTITPTHTNKSEIITNNQSFESIIDFGGSKTDLVASIENFLEKQKNDESFKRVVVVADVINENQRVDNKINESFQQQSVAPSRIITTNSVDAIELYNSNSDNDSIVLTSSLYEEVIKGESINDEITAAINQLETIEYDKYQQNNSEPINSLNFDRIDSIEDDIYSSLEFNTPQKKLTETIESEQTLTNKSNTKLSKYFPTKKNSPTYKQIKHSIRNSIRRSSKFFKATYNQKSPLPSPLANNQQLQQKRSFSISTTTGGRHNCREYEASSSMIELSDSYMLKLTNQITHQQEIRQQLRNAIDVCRNSDGLRHSIELVEAERLMLLSQKKESSAKEELIRIDYDDEGLTENFNLTGMANIQLNCIEFEFGSPPFKQNDQNNKYFFITLCSYRDQVMASLSKPFPSSVGGNGGHYHSTISLSSSTNSATDHHHNHTVNIEPSRFRLHAQLQITLNDLWPMKTQSKPICNKFTSSGVTFSCSNQVNIGEIGQQMRNTSMPIQTNDAMNKCSLDVYSEIHLDMPNVNGFLVLNDTIIGDAISRHWCWINGCYLNMSRKPNDDLTKPPQESVLSIDLTACMNDEITIDSTQHPNIFTIDVYNKNRSQFSSNEQQIKKYIFSCGRKNGDDDLKVWVHEINRILVFLRNWNL